MPPPTNATTVTARTIPPELTPEPATPPPDPPQLLANNTDLELVATGRWSRFLSSALEHVKLAEFQERNAAVAEFFDAIE